MNQKQGIRPVFGQKKGGNMKNYGFLLLALVTLVGAGCSTKGSDSTQQEVATEEFEAVKELDLTQIMDAVEAKFPTVQETKIISEENDPYKNLGKEGFYTAGAAFWDTRTEFSEEYVEESKKGRWGATAGGMIEVYETEEYAQARIDYMQEFVGNALLNPGAFKRLEKVVIRASSKLTATQQDEIMAFLEEQVTK